MQEFHKRGWHDTRAGSVMSDSLQPHGLQPTRLLCPWNFPGKNTVVGCHFLLEGVFSTQGLNLHVMPLLQWQKDSLHWPPGKSKMKLLVLYSDFPQILWICIHFNKMWLTNIFILLLIMPNYYWIVIHTYYNNLALKRVWTRMSSYCQCSS